MKYVYKPRSLWMTSKIDCREIGILDIQMPAPDLLLTISSLRIKTTGFEMMFYTSACMKRHCCISYSDTNIQREQFLKSQTVLSMVYTSSWSWSCVSAVCQGPKSKPLDTIDTTACDLWICSRWKPICMEQIASHKQAADILISRIKRTVHCCWKSFTSSFSGTNISKIGPNIVTNICIDNIARFVFFEIFVIIFV